MAGAWTETESGLQPERFVGNFLSDLLNQESEKISCPNVVVKEDIEDQSGESKINPKTVMTVKKTTSNMRCFLICLQVLSSIKTLFYLNWNMKL